MRLPIPVSWDVRPPIPSPIIASMKMFFPRGRRYKTPVEIKKPTYPILLVTMNRHSVLLLGTESGLYAILAPLVQLRLMRIGADKSATPLPGADEGRHGEPAPTLSRRLVDCQQPIHTPDAIRYIDVFPTVCYTYAWRDTQDCC